MDQPARETETPGFRLVKKDSEGRRTRLRDFQTQLMTRMQAAKTGEQVRVNQLGVLIGQTRYLIDLREAGEIVSAGNMTEVPLTKGWYLGLANIRGNLTSVVDFAHFIGHSLTNREGACRIIAFASGLAFNSGLLVSQVLGLRNSNEMLVEAASDHDMHLHKPWIINRFRDRDGQLWFELSLSLLVQDQDFLHVGL
jgi:twitching motility protein PilI